MDRYIFGSEKLPGRVDRGFNQLLSIDDLQKDAEVLEINMVLQEIFEAGRALPTSNVTRAIDMVGLDNRGPLNRREGGIIGSAANLTSSQGLTIRSASPASGLSSLLFLCDSGNHQVQVFDANSGVFIRSIGTGVNGAAAGQLSYPTDAVVRVLPSGDSLLYVSDSRNNRIQLFNAETGAHVRMLGEGDLDYPCGLALHAPPAASQLPTLLFVASYKQNAVKVFNPDTGSLVRIIGPGAATRVGAGSALDGPFFIALRTAARGLRFQTLLYVSEYKHRVQVFDADTGALVRTIGAGDAGAGLDQLEYPRGLALQESTPGSGAPCLLYVADYSNDRIQAFDADTGAYVRTIGAGRGSAVGQLDHPIGVTLHPGPDGSALLFVSELAAGNKRVQVFVV